MRDCIYFLIGRHRNMTVLFTTQKLTAASVGIRQNADKVVLFYTVDRNVLKVRCAACNYVAQNNEGGSGHMGRRVSLGRRFPPDAVKKHA
jgi:hypothetical protein